MTTTDTEVTVTPEDVAAWERYGPAIFHCEMTGPEALARHRTLTPAQAAGPMLLEALKRVLDRGYVSKHIGEEHDDHMMIVAAITQAEGPQANG